MRLAEVLIERSDVRAAVGLDRHGVVLVSGGPRIRRGHRFLRCAARAQALAAEKQAVLDKAAAEAAALDATGKAGSTAADRVAALDDALRSLPENVTTTITVTEVRNSSATTSGGGSSEGGSSSGGSAAGGSAKAAGGVEGYTTGPTTLTVGDNPGGVEYVKVVPISGRGRSSITGSGIRMAGGGEALVDAAAA